MQLTRMFPSILKKVPQTKTIYATIDQVYMWFYWTNIYKNLVCLTDVRFSFLKGGMAGALPRVTDGQKRDGDNREWKHQSDKYNCWMTLHHALLTPSKSVVALWDIHSSLLHWRASLNDNNSIKLCSSTFSGLWRSILFTAGRLVFFMLQGWSCSW